MGMINKESATLHFSRFPHPFPLENNVGHITIALNRRMQSTLNSWAKGEGFLNLVTFFPSIVATIRILIRKLSTENCYKTKRVCK